jgi:site-specific DNA-methyltransferase (adenine-specific)
MERGARNRTLTLTEQERADYTVRLLRPTGDINSEKINNRTIHGLLDDVLPKLPTGFVDLLFLDPPYNLAKTFNGLSFKEQSLDEYSNWLNGLLGRLMPLLKPGATVYICGDWRSTAAIQIAASRYLTVRNRITWEREKGRGASRNWKNCAEDIWFCTVGDDYYFNPDAVKLRRRVIAPYRDPAGQPKDWEQTSEGDFRLTYPSNLWTDLTVPFWSMPENTDHPTQKPEKLLAKLILASSRPDDMIFDPFLGSGTTSVVAKKLGRRYAGVEVDETYCCFAEKRLALAEQNPTIQGYADGVFWERNSAK